MTEDDLTGDMLAHVEATLAWQRGANTLGYQREAALRDLRGECLDRIPDGAATFTVGDMNRWWADLDAGDPAERARIDALVRNAFPLPDIEKED